MSFASVLFALFLPAVLLGDLLLQGRPRARKTFLLLASYVFYGSWDARFLLLIAFSTGVDWFVGGRLAEDRPDRERRRLLALSLAANLGLLGVFKYCDWFLDSLNRLLALGGLGPLPLAHLILPVGISFYTFQTLSYTIDLYRRRIRPARSLLDFALFVAFFPQLVAGPIVRASEFLPQLERMRRPRPEDAARGLYAVLAGLVLKIVVADTFGARAVDPYYADVEAYGLLGSVLAHHFYAFQVYGDFAGYSLIAIGCARMLGFRLPVNFRAPYAARSMAELLRRWHISLTTWLRDYLYLPLGGSRGGPWRAARNLSLTMFLGGLWHGAAWHFAVWGLFLGVVLVGSSLREARSGPPRPGFLRAARDIFLTFHLWVLTGVWFRSPDAATAFRVYSTWTRLDGPLFEPWLLVMLAAVWAGHLAAPRLHPWLEERFVRAPAEVRGAVLVLVLGLLAAIQAGAQPFIYFQF